ncbi:AraC family transcriptional regulator [Paenibacillus hamazuiensis]|uniref:AraC family transcriptional regulator n=1 Tax=Paenibacillus hamazuiensis TaxID=2936508 RepID=UPI00200CC446|nr:AraC family transcriptional regulator [Paenibacillus hamazuiensis]
MDIQDVDPFLRSINEFERKHWGQPWLLQHTGDIYVNDKISESFFFKTDQHIAINKHPRFAIIPEHRHEFIEMSYVYSGTLTQTINNNKITLSEGQLIILDTNVAHSIEAAGENDIIINCLMRKSYYDSHLIHRLAGNNVLSEFFVNAVYKSQEHSEYILFPSQSSPRVRSFMTELVREYYSSDICSEEAIGSYLVLLFTELLRLHKDANAGSETDSVKRTVNMADIIHYMESRYQTIDLTSAAKHFHFHPNYLSKIIKDHFGQSFIKVVQDIRVKKASLLLKNTDLNIAEISEHVGYKNIHFFYKNFKERFRMSPAEYRAVHRNH